MSAGLNCQVPDFSVPLGIHLFACFCGTEDTGRTIMSFSIHIVDFHPTNLSTGTVKWFHTCSNLTTRKLFVTGVNRMMNYCEDRRPAHLAERMEI